MRRSAIFFCMFAAGCGGIDSSDGNEAPTALTSGFAAISSVVTTFDGSGSSDPDGVLVAWEWDFGDGSTGSGETVKHTYLSDGTYQVTLTVRDSQQKTDSITVPVVVQPLSSLAGTWVLSSTPESAICSTGGATYAVGFPAPTMNVTVTGTTIDAVASGTGTTLTGGFNGEGNLLVNATSDTTSQTCSHDGNPATIVSVQEALTATFAGAGSFTGTYSILFNWDDVFCNCTQIFEVQGSH